MRPAKLALLLLLTSAGNSTMALAQPPPDNPEKQIQEVFKTVQLNPEQKAKVKQIRESSRNRMQALRDELEKRRAELNQLLDNNADDTAVRQAFQQLQSIRMNLEKNRFERMLAIRSVLSDQQKAAFQNLRKRERAAYAAPGSADTRRE